MAPFDWRLVTVDIDGTLTVGHGWRPIAEAFGRLPDFERSNGRFRAHEIGEDEHLADLLDLATGRTVAEVEAVVARTPRLTGIADGVAELRALGARVALLTHNPTYVVDYYRRTFGFDDAQGIRAQSTDGGRIGAPHDVRADKPGALRALLARAGTSARATVHVGDGTSDAALFPRVGGGIAVNPASPEVEAAADRVVRTRDFGAIIAAIVSLQPRS